MRGDLPSRDPGRAADIDVGPRKPLSRHITPRKDGYKYLHKTERADINRLQPPDKLPPTLDRPPGRLRRAEELSWRKSIAASKQKSRACGAMLARCRATSPGRTISFRIVSPVRSKSCIYGRREPICGRGCSRYSTINM